MNQHSADRLGVAALNIECYEAPWLLKSWATCPLPPRTATLLMTSQFRKYEFAMGFRLGFQVLSFKNIMNFLSQ